MAYKEIEEGRMCLRFEIPGATVSYKRRKLFVSPTKYCEEFCPVVDISRGGIRFLSQIPLKIKSKVTLKISVPGEKVPLSLKGRVKWAFADSGKNYKYKIGVQFNPYAEKRGQNSPGTLEKIIALEQKFAPIEESDKKE